MAPMARMGRNQGTGVTAELLTALMVSYGTLSAYKAFARRYYPG